MPAVVVLPAYVKGLAAFIFTFAVFVSEYSTLSTTVAVTV